MSVLLIGSSVVTTLLIPAGGVPGGRRGVRPRARVPRARASRRGVRHDLRPQHDRDPVVRRRVGDGRPAQPRAALPAALRHGAGVGQATPAAGAASSPAITFLVTILFNADVDAQGGAYATGVLVLMTSAALAVTLAGCGAAHGRGSAIVLITLIFVYTTVVNIIERPEGMKIASLFIVAIIVHVAGLARAALDRAAGPRASSRTSMAHALHPRSGRRRRSGSSPTGPDTGLPEEYDHKLREAQRVAPPAAGERGAVPRSAAGRRVGVQRTLRGQRRGRGRPPRAALREPGDPERHRRAAALHPRRDRHDPARLLRLDRRQSRSPTC